MEEHKEIKKNIEIYEIKLSIKVIRYIIRRIRRDKNI